MQLDDKATAALLKALKALSDEYGLGMDEPALVAAQQQLHPKDASFYLQTLFASRTASHTEELGEAPYGAYPRLLASYAKASGGAFAPENIEADSGDNWDNLTLHFRHAGKKQRFNVNGVEDSGWFADEFVPALNRFAKRVGLPGRWVDFHNGDDACTSIYVPEKAQTRFRALRKKFSTVAEPEDAISEAEAEAFHRQYSLQLPPELACDLDKSQAAQRKAAWPEVEARLLAYHNKSEVKLLERYFLRGTGPNPKDFWSVDPIPLVYRLLLHPLQTDAAWCAITERVLSYRTPGETERMRQRAVGSSLITSREALERYIGDKPDLFGPARERLTTFLQSDRYRQEGERLYYHGAFAHADDISQCEWLAAATPVEKSGTRYDPALAEHWVDYLCGANGQWFMDRGPYNSPLRSLKVLLHQIAHYPPPVEGDSDYARQYFCQCYRDALNARALPQRLDSWWTILKQRASDKATALALE